jgi:hypothetical protein
MALRKLIQKFLEDQKETINNMRRMLEGTHQQMSVKECQESFHHSKKLKVDGPVTFLQLEHEVRQLAYNKWEKAGRPPGDGKCFWHAAEEELFGPQPFDGGYTLYVRNKNKGWDLTKVEPEKRVCS